VSRRDELCTALAQAGQTKPCDQRQIMIACALLDAALAILKLLNRKTLAETGPCSSPRFISSRAAHDFQFFLV